MSSIVRVTQLYPFRPRTFTVCSWQIPMPCFLLHVKKQPLFLWIDPSNVHQRNSQKVVLKLQLLSTFLVFFWNWTPCVEGFVRRAFLFDSKRMFVGRDRLLFFYNFGTVFQLFLLGGDCCDRFTVTKRTMIMTSVHPFILVKGYLWVTQFMMQPSPFISQEIRNFLEQRINYFMYFTEF